jgi:hypothetical protein
MNHYYPSGSGSGYFAISPSVSQSCGSYSLIFGYQQTQANKYVVYNSPSFSTWNGYLNYYAISVKIRVLFIDDWPSTGAI